MSSTDRARQRFPGKSKSPEKEGKDRKKQLTEDEAVSKASNKWIRHFVIAFTLSLLSPFFALILLPSPINPKEFPPLSPPAPFEGPLSLNNDLAFSDKIYENQLVGPESLVVDGEVKIFVLRRKGGIINGHPPFLIFGTMHWINATLDGLSAVANIYTGTMDGWVNHLYDGEVKRLVRFGQEPCGGYDNENTCGRPLGLRMDKNGRLLVCDAYHGLFRVDVKTGEYETLYKATTPVNGKTSKMLNDLDIDSKGRIYFTDSSTEWHRNQFFNILMEGDSTGRLLMYDPKSKTTKQVFGNLMFPNGVQLTPDKSALLITELSRARILKYDLKSKDVAVWADGLPGFPDNIRYDTTSQTYWVAMAMPRFANGLSILDYLAGKPWLRGIVAKIVSVSNVEKVKSYLKVFGQAEPQALAVEFDKDGHMISSLQDQKGEVIKAVSEVHFHNGLFYLGSYHENYIAQLDWKKAGDQ